MKWGLKVAVLVTTIFLSGCKTELYSGLSENEANQMIAVLAHEGINASKRTGSDGSLSLLVKEDDFVVSVEMLKHNGYPRRQQKNVDDLFPSGQLVSSPMQEQTKIDFLKEQSLEKMLSSVNGVISANVSIASALHDESGRQVTPPSAAVFIKYADSVDLPVLQNQLRSLVNRSVPGVSWDNISLVLQSVERSLGVAHQEEHIDSAPVINILSKPVSVSLLVWGGLGLLWAAGGGYVIVTFARRYMVSRRGKQPSLVALGPKMPSAADDND